MEIPKKISEEILYNTPYRNLICKEFIWRDWKTNKIYTTEQIWTNFWTMVLPITSDNKIIVCREFRYWVEDYIYNFPVWILEKELTEVENIKKELKEESWYTSEEINYIWQTMVWNYDSSIIKHYIAQNCTTWEQELENGEYISVEIYSKEKFEKIISDWEIICPLTLSCYSLAKFKWLI
jgi:ADP-ribose pyrophosphatase